jgi:rhodanese-related sulfurtransferase
MPSAFHPPRGMLEFWVDPQSPHHNPVFNLPGTRYLLFCAGGWRSALAALTTQPMGVENVVHLDGGVGDGKQAGEPVAQRPAGRPAG